MWAKSAGGVISATSISSEAISAPALTGATGAGLFVIAAGAFTAALTDTVTANVAIKITVKVAEIG